MEDIHAHYEQVREIESAIKAKHGEGTHFIISVDNRKAGIVAGRVFEVDLRGAANGIIHGTHRLANEQEIAQYKEELESRRQAIHNEEYQRKQQFALPPELAGLVELALAKTKPSAKEK